MLIRRALFALFILSVGVASLIWIQTVSVQNMSDTIDDLESLGWSLECRQSTPGDSLPTHLTWLNLVDDWLLAKGYSEDLFPISILGVHLDGDWFDTPPKGNEIANQLRLCQGAEDIVLQNIHLTNQTLEVMRRLEPITLSLVAVTCDPDIDWAQLVGPNIQLSVSDVSPSIAEAVREAFPKAWISANAEKN